MFSLVEDLRSLSECHSAYRFGAAIHYSPKKGLDEPGLKISLTEKGHKDVEIELIQAGIEDCFMELMTER